MSSAKRVSDSSFPTLLRDSESEFNNSPMSSDISRLCSVKGPGMRERDSVTKGSIAAITSMGKSNICNDKSHFVTQLDTVIALEKFAATAFCFVRSVQCRAWKNSLKAWHAFRTVSSSRAFVD